MPHFRYSARDAQGNALEGTVEAPSSEAAIQDLARRQIWVEQIMAAPAPTPSAAVATKPRPAQAKAPAPKAKPSPKPAAPQQAPKPQARTKPASDKDRLFLFAQLGNQLKAGIGPAQALSFMVDRSPPHLRASLSSSAEKVAGGGSMADAFAEHPATYPEHVTALVRAGEQGGFLPEACQVASSQAENAHRFNRSFWWRKWVTVNALIALPLIWLVTRTVLAAWPVVEAMGEEARTSDALRAVMQEMVKRLIWPIGPETLAIWLVVIVLWRALSAPWAMRLRHRAALHSPLLAARTRHECLTVFTWAMSKLAQAGHSPDRSWALAAECVPNLAVREKLQKMGTRMTGTEKLSEMVESDGLFPHEYASYLSTANLTGDLPGALEQLSRISKAEFDAAQESARTKANRMGSTILLITSGIILVLLYRFFYTELMSSVLKGLE